MTEDLCHTEATEATNKQRGASLIEYALLVALIAIVSIAAVTSLGGTTSEPFSDVQSGFIS